MDCFHSAVKINEFVATENKKITSTTTRKDAGRGERGDGDNPHTRVDFFFKNYKYCEKYMIISAMTAAKANQLKYCLRHIKRCHRRKFKALFLHAWTIVFEEERSLLRSFYFSELIRPLWLPTSDRLDSDNLPTQIITYISYMLFY